MKSFVLAFLSQKDVVKKYRKIFGTIIEIPNPPTQLSGRKFPKLSSGVLFCGSSQVCLLLGLLRVMSGAWLEQNMDNAFLVWLPGKRCCLPVLIE